jgi:hypothetical protein
MSTPGRPMYARENTIRNPLECFGSDPGPVALYWPLDAHDGLGRHNSFNRPARSWNAWTLRSSNRCLDRAFMIRA